VGSAALAKGDLVEAERHLNASWKAQFVPGTATLLGALRKVQQRSAEAAEWFAVSVSFPGVAAAGLPKDVAASLASARPAADLMMRERTITLAPPPLDDFNEEVLLLIDGTGRLSSARRLSARSPAACDRYLVRLGKARLGFPALPGGTDLKLVRTGLLVCSKVTRCSLVLDTPDTRPEEDASKKGPSRRPRRNR
jgi:hypothetical protein